ncbi:MAG TPA: PDZ domain-containing protein [Trichormus sp.]
MSAAAAALTIVHVVNLPALADHETAQSKSTAQQLQPDVPQLDTRQVSPSAPIETPTDVPAQKPVLQGNVSALDQVQGQANQGPPPMVQYGNIYSNGQVPSPMVQYSSIYSNAQIPQNVDLQALMGMAQMQQQQALKRFAKSPYFNLMINGSNPFMMMTPQRPTMSSEQFRQLNYGVLGIDSVQDGVTAGSVVRTLYPGCPAESSGMRVGDRMIKVNDYTMRPGDGQKVMWHLMDGKADTPCDVTVNRNGELLTFHLVRMNMEDIPDFRTRFMFEMLLSAYGPPKSSE